MMSSIVCGVDASQGAKEALRFARELCDRLGLHLVLAHAVPAPAAIPSRAGIQGAARYTAFASDGALRAGTHLLEELAASEGLDNVRVRCEFGNPGDRIRAIAREEEAELIVVGSRGRGPWRSAILGSVSLNLASSAPCPVVVTPVDAALPTEDDALATVVCGVDDSDGARAALRVAEMLAIWLGARLVLAHVAPLPPVPGNSAVRLTASDVRRKEIEEGEELLTKLSALAEVEASVERRVALGTPGGALADIAEEEDAGLVIVGSSGRGAFRSAVLGSVFTELMATSRRRVLVVPPDAAADR
jgi:nucleotide-binding universal stress UspA family protein